ncbi:MAG: hypothetical protein ACXVDK_01220 [Bacteroidia bacterium]
MGAALKYIGFLGCMLLMGCKGPRIEKAVTVSTWTIDFEDPSITNKVKDGSGNGTYFSRVNGQSPFGAGLNYPIPDSLNNSFIRACVDFDARISGCRFGETLVVSYQKQDTVIKWNAFDINNYTFSKNKWVHVSDSLQFYFDKAGRKLELRIFGFNVHPKGELDIDNLKISIKKVSVPAAS